ncbi:MAG: COQ9 family protein [Robiginitomaculum sp.]|nr:MAG: COQ9 family protein [Robiginitomaculum sp.]
MSIDSLNTQPHLDVIRAGLLAAMLERTAFEGWTSGVLAAAAKAASIDPGAVDLACPRGELDILAYWSAKLDEAMLAAMEAADMPAMRIRERVTFAVQARLEAIGEHNREAASRAAARLGRPDALLMGKQLIWQSADTIWRALGDTSTDYNYYTKRTILSAVLGATIMVWFEGDEERTKRFLGRRIENVMQFERFKGKVRKAVARWPDPVAALARLRYGRGKARPRRM